MSYEERIEAYKERFKKCKQHVFSYWQGDGCAYRYRECARCGYTELEIEPPSKKIEDL